MNKIIKSILLFATICCIASSCGDKGDDTVNPGGGGGGTPDPNAFTITPFEKLNQGASAINSHAAEDVLSHSSLKMNYRSYIELGKKELGNDVTEPHYPRIKKMRNGNYVLFVNQKQHGGSCYHTISSNLKLWEPKGKIFSSVSITDLTFGNPNTRMFATTDAVQLANGEMLAVASYRAITGPGDVSFRDMPLDAGLMLRRSSNNGMTWSDPMPIYQGVNWEPFLLQLSSGEIHCYFTDASSGPVDKDTGTAMVVSKDNGATWTPAFGQLPYYVIRSSYVTIHEGKLITCYNDQMPSVIQLNDSDELAAALETARPTTNYDISFAYSGEDGEWTRLNPDQTGPEDRVNKSFQGAAPYLGQFRSGETVLSYSGMNIKMGNAKARKFPTSNTNDYTPFSGKSGFWGSTHVADGHHIIATMPNTSDNTVLVAQLILNHRITATTRKVVVDGSDSEWSTTDEALFVGAKSQAQATLRCSSDADHVYFLAEALDNDIKEGDHVIVYLTSPATNNSLTANQAFRIKVSFTGLVSSEVYNGSAWIAISDLGVLVKTKYENKKTDKSGYRAEISIPRSKLTVKSGEIYVNYVIYDTDGGEDAISASFTNTAKWIPINGL